MLAGKALRANITTLGPRVLPLSEIVVFAGNLIARKVLRMKGVKAYVPDFQEAAQHICIHTGMIARAFEIRHLMRRPRRGACMALHVTVAVDHICLHDLLSTLLLT
jgi:hypothetical protein